MARHFKDLPTIEDGDDGLDSIVTPQAPVARPVRGDESVTRAARPVQGTYSNDDTTGFIAVVGEADNHRTARKKYNRRTKKSAHFTETDPYDIRGYRKGRGGKGKKIARTISTLLFVAGLILLLVAGGLWVKARLQYHAQDVEIERKQTFATVSDDPSVAPIVDWGKLRADNPDAVAWIMIPGTTVNFPVYQGPDNDTYLHTNAEGEYALGGEIFLDFENTAPGMIDPQTIVYGHHLRNGAMFKPVADMDNQAYFDSIETVWYVTPDGEYELVPLACYYADPYDLDVRRSYFDSDEDYRAYLQNILDRAVTKREDAGEIIYSCDHVLALITCNYLPEMNGDGRTIVICVPKSELPSQG